MVMWNRLIRRLSPVYAIMWPNIRRTGICLFNHWRMRATCKLVVPQERRSLVSSCLVTYPVLLYPICHCRYWPICRQHLKPTQFAKAFCKNSPRYKHVLTSHWKTLKRITRATFAIPFASSQPFYHANTFLSIARMKSSLQPLVSGTSRDRTNCLTVGPFQVILNTPDTVTIDEDGIHYTVSIHDVTRAPDKTDTAEKIDKASIPENA